MRKLNVRRKILEKKFKKNIFNFRKLLNHPKASQLLGAMFGGMGGAGANPFGGEDEEMEEKPAPPPKEEPKPEPPKPDPKDQLSPEQRDVRIFEFTFFCL